MEATIGGGSTRRRRAPLTRDDALAAAVLLADRDGLDALSMRRLAGELGVEAMSLYHHVANKDEILDGMVDAVFAEIVLPSGASDWKSAMRERAHSAREALTRHPWAVGLLDSRSSPGPNTLRHHDVVLGSLRRAGFTVGMAAHAFSVIDSYVYGFVLQEEGLPFESDAELEQLASVLLDRIPADEYPHLREITSEYMLQATYDFGEEFAFGLDLILDGLERAAFR